jgi:hypothetical protein
MSRPCAAGVEHSARWNSELRKRLKTQFRQPLERFAEAQGRHSRHAWADGLQVAGCMGPIYHLPFALDLPLLWTRHEAEPTWAGRLLRNVNRPLRWQHRSCSMEGRVIPSRESFETAGLAVGSRNHSLSRIDVPRSLSRASALGRRRQHESGEACQEPVAAADDQPTAAPGQAESNGDGRVGLHRFGRGRARRRRTVAQFRFVTRQGWRSEGTLPITDPIGEGLAILAGFERCRSSLPIRSTHSARRFTSPAVLKSWGVPRRPNASHAPRRRQSAGNCSRDGRFVGSGWTRALTILWASFEES